MKLSYLIKGLTKALFCHHKYQPYNYASFLNDNNELCDTWYIFRCIKCNREKRIVTYGKDKILNSLRR